jgi:hypothetical protein
MHLNKHWWNTLHSSIIDLGTIISSSHKIYDYALGSNRNKISTLNSKG